MLSDKEAKLETSARLGQGEGRIFKGKRVTNMPLRKMLQMLKWTR